LRLREKKKGRKKGKLHLDSIDIREVLDDLNIHYTEAGKNVSDGWIGVSCPFCNDQSNHLGVNLIHKTVSCFKCGTSGTVIKYLAEELRSFNKAISVLGDAVPRELRSFDTQARERSVKVELPKEAHRKITKYHAGYLVGRNFDPMEIGDLYNLHYCGPLGNWANRIIVPIVRQYRLVTFTSVDISDDTNIRYKHLGKEDSIIHAKEWLFGLEHTDGHSVIVVEGLFDMMRIGPGAVCTFGTKVTPEQIKLLSKFNVVKVLFDGDDAGRVNGDRLANNLAPFCDVRLFTMPEGDDPDKLSKDDIRQIKES
jgi:DNA primase